MSLHANLRPIDRKRSTQAMTAYACNDRPALDGVLAETAEDPDGANGLVLALLEYVDWVTRSTGAVLPGDPGPDRPRGELS